MSKTDLRILKTKKNIYESFLTLLSQKTFEEIKVSEICELAMTNRSTFYSHFEDKYMLLNEFINDLKSALIIELKKNKRIGSFKEYYMDLIRILLDYISERKDIYSRIMLNNRNSIATDMIYDTLKEDITLNFKDKNYDEIPGEFISNFYLGAIFYVVIEWIKQPKYSKEEIIKYIEELIPNKL